MRFAAALLLGLISWSLATGAQDLRRASVRDLKLGEAIAAQPAAAEFRGFACGSNGGPPRQPLSGWSDFKRCSTDVDGLREVYFEYDDEYEFVARARNLPREVARWAGTTEAGFPIMASALFDDAGVLRAVRIVTDSRPDYRSDPTEAAIASALAGEIHGLKTLKADIEDAAHNTTRFLVLSRVAEVPDAGNGPCITTFVFRVRNVPAALYKTLGGFATNGVNLTKLESYMVGGHFAATEFYADADGHPDERPMRLALEELRFFTREFKVLGVYLASKFRVSGEPSG